MRAWGALACWDDAGSATTLQDFDPDVDYANQVYLGPVYNRIRQSLYHSRMPDPERCGRCVCLRTRVEEIGPYLVSRKCLKGKGRNERLGGRSHDDPHLGPIRTQTPYQLGRFVGRDPSADPQQHLDAHDIGALGQRNFKGGVKQLISADGR